MKVPLADPEEGNVIVVADLKDLKTLLILMSFLSRFSK